MASFDPGDFPGAFYGLSTCLFVIFHEDRERKGMGFVWPSGVSSKRYFLSSLLENCFLNFVSLGEITTWQ